jgi:hypothetical protein
MSPARVKKAYGRRPDIEADLADKFHVNYTLLHEVPTDQFDIDKSLANQARFEPLDEETVDTYREAVERGDEFPAVVAYRPGRALGAKLVIIDGNHRLVAHDRAGKPINVYEVERTTKGNTIALMTYAFNTKHGRPTSEEERVSHAIYLIDNGAPQEAAAAAVNVPMRLLKRALAKANADRRADEVGVDRREWESLAGTARSRLLNISTDEGFGSAVHLAYAARLGAEEVFDLVTLLNNSGKSGTKQRNLVKAETDRYSERIQDVGAGVLGSSGRKPTSPKGRVGMILGQVLALPDDLGAIARAYADNERPEAAGRLLDASERLRKLATTIDPSQA